MDFSGGDKRLVQDLIEMIKHRKLNQDITISFLFVDALIGELTRLQKIERDYQELRKRVPASYLGLQPVIDCAFCQDFLGLSSCANSSPNCPVRR